MLMLPIERVNPPEKVEVALSPTIVVVAVPPIYIVSKTDNLVVDAWVKDAKPVVPSVPLSVRLLNVGLAEV